MERSSGDLKLCSNIHLLPDREDGTVANWPAAHPDVEIICRDRVSDYREGATKGEGRFSSGADL